MKFKLFLILIFSTTISLGQSNLKSDNQDIKDNKINASSQNFCLKSDLEKFNGFYTSIESNGVNICRENLPSEILNWRKQSIKSIKLDYLRKIKNGYIINFAIQYENSKILVISSLNSEYCMVDFRIYTDGLNEVNVLMDTIAMTSYNKDTIIIEIMHPNNYEEPNFKVDGIRIDKLIINNDLKIKNAR